MSQEPIQGYKPLGESTSDVLFRCGFAPGWPVVEFSSEEFGGFDIAKAICPENPDDRSNRRAFTLSCEQETEMATMMWQLKFIPELMRVVWDGHLSIPTLDELQGNVPEQDEVPEPQRYVRGRLAHSQARNIDAKPTDQIHLLVNGGMTTSDSMLQVAPYWLDRSPDEGLFYLPRDKAPTEPVPTPSN